MGSQREAHLPGRGRSRGKNDPRPGEARRKKPRPVHASRCNPPRPRPTLHCSSRLLNKRPNPYRRLGGLCRRQRSSTPPPRLTALVAVHRSSAERPPTSRPLKSGGHRSIVVAASAPNRDVGAGQVPSSLPTACRAALSLMGYGREPCPSGRFALGRDSKDRPSRRLAGDLVAFGVIDRPPAARTSPGPAGSAAVSPLAQRARVARSHRSCSAPLLARWRLSKGGSVFEVRPL